MLFIAVARPFMTAMQGSLILDLLFLISQADAQVIEQADREQRIMTQTKWFDQRASWGFHLYENTFKGRHFPKTL